MTLMSANIFLTLVNRSFHYSLFTTLRCKNNLVLLIIAVTVALIASLLFIPPFTHFFAFEGLNALQLTISILTGGISVLWLEGIKAIKRKKNKS